MNENDPQTEKQSKKYLKSSKNTFIIVGHNGASLVEPVLTDLGWVKLQDKNTDDFKLKWTEIVSHISYGRFREGEQLVNHIPNCGMITNKLGLLTSLRSYERLMKESNKCKNLEMNIFVPETYIIDDLKEREQFFDAYKDGDIWINKPTGLNQGKGITLVRDLEEFRKDLDERDILSRSSICGVKARIVQRYLSNPLLLQGRKFDIRSYMYIASTSPYLVLYCPGYIRLSMNPYSNEDTDLITHLTNQYIQKKSPNYGDVKEDTVWSMDKFNDYLNEVNGDNSSYKPNWAKTTLGKQMQQIMLYVFNSVKNKLATRVGFFEIFGFDFMVDANFKVWLIEVNVNPALHINCTLLKEILPPMIEEVILLALECFEKSVKIKRPLVPLENAKLFTILYSESSALYKNRAASYCSLRSWIPPRYRSHSLSPTNLKPDDVPIPTTIPSPVSPLAKVYTARIILPSSVSLAKEFRFEASLRNYQKINTPYLKDSDSSTKSERVHHNQNTTPLHNRSKSYNPILSERRDNRSSFNFDANSINDVISVKTAVPTEKEPNVMRERMSTSVTFESLTLDSSKHKTDLFKPNRNFNPIRKTQSVRIREPAPISLVQVVTGRKTTECGDGKGSKTNMYQVIKRKKVYDRSS